jgi:hypothetical protein
MNKNQGLIDEKYIPAAVRIMEAFLIGYLIGIIILFALNK